MINPKNICISATIGFLLSFLIGLFSDVHFSAVVLRALLFALLFGAFYTGASFLYFKFLVADNGGFSSEPDMSASKPGAGGVVNIVIDDTNLPDEELSPRFTVLNNHSDLNRTQEAQPASGASGAANSPAAPVASVSPAGSVPSGSSETVSPAPASSSAGAAFKPVSLGDVTQKSDAASAESSPVESAQPAAGASGGQEQSLDELPDISEMQEASVDVASELDSSDDGIVSDSDFATGGAKMKEQPVSGDTAVMAKAIQTLLAKDN